MSAARSASLASVFGEVLTAIVRVRFRLQPVSDAEVFRAQVRQSLQAPMHQARTLGYPGETVQAAVFAVVALLDESVLNLQDPVFAQWARRPLQEELFGGHLAGETFFRNLRDFLLQPDSPQLADVLELYSLCLLLGYRGRHALGGSGELYAQLRQARDRIQRIRGDARMTSAEVPPRSELRRDPDESLNRYLLWTACALAVLLLLVFTGYRVSLAYGVDALQAGALNGL